MHIPSKSKLYASGKTRGHTSNKHTHTHGSGVGVIFISTSRKQRPTGRRDGGFIFIFASNFIRVCGRPARTECRGIYIIMDL